jgi:hypothetical protein
MPGLDNSHFPAFFRYGTFRAEVAARSAPVTKLVENKHGLRHHSYRFIGADSGTLSTESAFGIIDPGHRDANRLTAGNNRSEKQMIVGFLDVTIE